MLYTRKGDKGDTSLFGCKQRFSKNSALIEVLGSLDEINSLLGICKIKAVDFKFKINGQKISEIIEQIQQNLFIIQAKIAGTNKNITQEKIYYTEKIIDTIEKEIPPIKSFFLAGGSELAAYLDYARTISRWTERKTIAYFESEKIQLNDEILAYLNRLSSLLYALTRFVNFKLKIKENFPLY